MGSCSCLVMAAATVRRATPTFGHRTAMHMGQSSLFSRRKAFVLFGAVESTTIGAVLLADRDHELGEIVARADDARAGRGGMLIVSGESGAGKTAFIEAFVDRWVKDE